MAKIDARLTKQLAVILILTGCIACQSGYAQTVSPHTVEIIEELLTPTLPLPPPSDSVCFQSIQNRIAWDTNGSTRWAASNVQKLCGTALNSREPGVCFDRVMHRRVAPSENWRWQTALDLCKGTLDASATIRCYNDAVGRGLSAADSRGFCGNYENIRREAPPPIGNDELDPDTVRYDIDASDWTASDGLQLTPATELTRRAIVNSSRENVMRHTQRVPNERYVADTGYPSRVVQVYGGNTLDGCRRACAGTEQCNAFTIEDAHAARPGGYCALIFGDVYRRYDRHWRSASHGYSTYFDPSSSAARMMPVRLVVEAGGGGSRRLTRLSRENGNATSSRGLIDCARSCLGNPQCKFFHASSSQCGLYDAAPYGQGTEVFIGDFDFFASVASYEQPGLNRAAIE